MTDNHMNMSAHCDECNSKEAVATTWTRENQLKFQRFETWCLRFDTCRHTATLAFNLRFCVRTRPHLSVKHAVNRQ